MSYATLVLCLLLVVGSMAQDPCSSFKKCSDCLGTMDMTYCGFCKSGAGSCMTGNINGPTSGSCPGADWIFTVTEVKPGANKTDVIDPTFAEVFLRRGIPLTLTVKVVPQPVPLDVYVLEDLSESFGNDLVTLRQSIVSLMTSVRSQIIDNTFFGMGGFIDKAILPLGKYLNCADNNNDPWTNGCDNFPFKPILKLCNDDAAMVDALTVTQVSSNYDFPEATLDGMALAAVCGDYVGWREGARHILLVSTDATYHMVGDGFAGGIHHPNNMDCNVARRPIVTGANFPSGAGTGEDYVSVGQLKEVLIRNNIVPIFAVLNDRPTTGVPPVYMNQPNPYPFYVDLRDRLGFGFTAPLTADSSNLFDVIQTAYNSISREVVLFVDSDPYFIVTDLTPAAGYNNVVDYVPVYFNVTLTASATSKSSFVKLKVMGLGSIVLNVTVGAACDCGISCPDNCNGRGICDCGQCLCDYPYAGSSCACTVDVVCDPADCNGHGVCDCGDCVCYPEWQTTNGICNCSTSLCSNNCSGHGSCNCGQCTCDIGYKGLDCSCSTGVCPGVTPCSGNGTCYCGECICNPGYKGDDCMCEDIVCPKNCSNVGVCACGGKCDCPSGYEGDFCECNRNVGCPDDCLNSLGQGTCGCNSICDCAAGWGGANCNCSTLPCPNGCSGQGTCSCGKCTCTGGYTGEDCGCDPTKTCPGGCGNGTCVCGACECDAYYTGPTCQCYNVPCPSNCFAELGQGACVCGGCECTGTWSGVDCNCAPTACDGNDCSGHGTCNCGECVCDNDYTGANCNCSLIPCPNNCFNHLGQGICDCGECICAPEYVGTEDCSCRTGSTCPNNCTDPLTHEVRGTCACDTCICKPGWGGEDCTCDRRPCPGDGKCSYPNGECDCGKCNCTEGWTGDYCNCVSTATCASLNDCNGHGTCGCNGTCVCDPGYQGLACECENVPCLDDCNGRGVCECGQCKCDQPTLFGGDWCECDLTKTCLNNCSNATGLGECKCGVCECTLGYGGDDCSCSALPCPGDCNDHGTCSCSKCNCTTGWAGDDCMCSSDATCPTCVHGTCCSSTTLGGACESTMCGQCICAAGWGGTNCNCSQSACPGDCFDHGTCECGQCKCDTGYSAENHCFCIISECPNDCSDHGTCACGTCTCDPGWGDNLNGTKDCSCSQFPCENDCSNHGTCECGKCKCNPGWGYSDCSCDMNIACPSTCGGDRGFCCSNATLYSGDCTDSALCGTCICKTNYANPLVGTQDCSCSQAPCENDCNFNGTCVCGVCDCNANWTGSDCGCNKNEMVGVCPDDCIDLDHGKCCSGPNLGVNDDTYGPCTYDKCGECLCASGWSGANCSCSTTPCPLDCSFHGQCVCGVCECDDGWQGLGCGCNITKLGNCMCNANSAGSCCTFDKYSAVDGSAVCNETQCGDCLCDSDFDGPTCECSTDPCPTGRDSTGAPLPTCNGHGDCICSLCECETGWIDDPNKSGWRANCSCPLTPNCTALNDCSGHGTCSCTSCICDSAYTGKNCSVCIGNETFVCPDYDPCMEALSCDECFMSAIVLSNNCSFCDGYCVSSTRATGDCSNDKASCIVKPPINYQELATAGGLVASGVVGIGLLAAAVLKLWQRHADRKEWREFEASQKAMQFNSKENQLFTAKDPRYDPRLAERKNVNPLYDDDTQDDTMQ